MNRRSGNPVSYSSPLSATTSASVRQYHHVHRRPGQVGTGVAAATKLDFHELANFALHEKEYQEGSKNGSTSSTFDDPSLHHKSNVSQQQQPFDSPSTDRRHGPVTKLGFHDLANFALHGQERERKDDHLIHSSNRNGSSFDDHHQKSNSNHHQKSNSNHHQKSNSNHHVNDYPSLVKQQPVGSEGDLIDFSSIVDAGAFGGSNSSSSSSSSNVLIRSNSSGSACNGGVGGSIKSGGSKIPPGLVKGHSVDSAVASFNQDFPSLVPSGSTSSSGVNNSVWDPTKTRLIGNGMSKLTIITKQIKPVTESTVVKATTAPVLTEAIKTTAGLSLVTKKRGSLPASSTSSVVGLSTVPKESSVTGNGSTGIQTRGMNPSPSVPVPSSASVSIGSKSTVTPSLEILVTKPNKSRENRNEFLKSLRSDSSNKAASSTGTSDGNKNVSSMDRKSDESNRSGNGSSIESSVKDKSDPTKASTSSPVNEDDDPLVSVDLDKMTASPEERKGISVLIEQQHGIKVNQMKSFQEGKNSQGEKNFHEESFQEGKNRQEGKNHQEGVRTLPTVVLPTVVMGSLDQVLVSNKENVLSRLSSSSNVEGRMNESLRMNQPGGGQVLEEATSCDSILSSSLEAEQRLLREMGWREEDADDSLFAPLTEDEVKEFRARFKTNHHHVLGHSGQYQVGSSFIGGSILGSGSLVGSSSLTGGGSNQFSSAGNGQLLDLNITGTTNGPPGFESSNRSNFAPPGFGLKQGSSSAFNPHFFANRPASLTTDPPAEEEDSSSDDSSSDEE